MKIPLLLPVLLLAVCANAQTNYALSFNGTNNYVSINTPITNASSYTKEAWVYSTSNSGARNIISSQNTPFWVNNGILSAGQGGNYSLVTDASAFPLNVWVYVAVTYDASTATMKLYRDGTLVSTATSVPAYASESTVIGSHTGVGSYFQGNIDEVRIWNKVLTQAQLKSSMYKGPTNNATSLSAYYKFNDGSGSTLTSSCTNTTGMNGTLQNSPSWVSSPVKSSSNALSFDGTDDYVTIPYNSSEDITSAITLEAWVYATKNTGIQNVIDKSSNLFNTGYIFPRTDDGWSHVEMYLHIGGGWKILSATYPSLNAWHHLAATYDGATMKLYIDGVLAASQAQTGSIATNLNVLALGNQTGFSEYFGGYADEFRVWNVARTQAQISANMGIELDPTTQTGLVSYYNANMGSASGSNSGLATLVDQKGTNNGTLTNFSLSGASSNLISQNSGITVLPLQWLSFSVQKQHDHAAINWSTANEINTSDFTIQRSNDGSTWQNMGTIPANNSNSGIQFYNYSDAIVFSGVYYYRIMQKDINGRSSYSDVRTIRFDSKNTPVTVLANPVNNKQLNVQVNTPVTLNLYTSNGALIWKKQVDAGSQTINLQNHTTGTYLLKANEQIEKIIVP